MAEEKSEIEESPQSEEAAEKETQADAKFQEGVRLYRMKEWDKALEEFLSKARQNRETHELNSEEKMELTYYLGLCYTKLEQYEEALLYLEQVVTGCGNLLRVYQCRMTLAYIYVITKRVKMAEFELKRLQTSGLESPLLYNTLAYAAWCQKKYKYAIELYEKTLDIDSNNATAMNSMGYILADAGIDVMRALRLCRRAVDARPQSAAYLDSLGWAYYKSGEVVEARTWLRRALEIAPDHDDIINHFKIVTGEKV